MQVVKIWKQIIQLTTMHDVWLIQNNIILIRINYKLKDFFHYTLVLMKHIFQGFFPAFT